MKNRSSLIKRKICKFLWELCFFFQLHFLQNACFLVGMAPGRGHLCHIDMFLFSCRNSKKIMIWILLFSRSVMNFIHSLTGHDTTTSAISFIMYSLAQHQDIQDKCRAEVDTILEGRDSDSVEWFVFFWQGMGTRSDLVIYTVYRPRWLSWMCRPTGDQEVAGSTPAEVGNILSWRLIMKYFLRSFSPFRWFKKGSCQFLAKECAQYWLTA